MRFGVTPRTCNESDDENGGRQRVRKSSRRLRFDSVWGADPLISLKRAGGRSPDRPADVSVRLIALVRVRDQGIVRTRGSAPPNWQLTPVQRSFFRTLVSPPKALALVVGSGTAV